MGDPKRIRKKYAPSKIMWDRNRIAREHDLKEKFGLRNLRELWTATTEVTRIRKNARDVLSNRASEKVGRDIISRLSRYNIVAKDAKIDDLLSVTPESILNRRLQSLVFRAGLAKTPKQARQLITHGFISVSGRKVKSPGYLVEAVEESMIGYYKPINLNQEKHEASPEQLQGREQPKAEAAPRAGEGEGA